MINWVALIIAVLLIIALLLIPMNWVWKIVGIFVVIILGAIAFWLLSRWVNQPVVKVA